MNNRVSVCLVVVAVACVSAWAGAPSETEAREALQWVYIHGVTEEIAHERVGPQWEPLLRNLLFEVDFPRRDNVVWFLSWLGGAGSVDALLALLESPPAGWDAPQEDRALLYAPRALGHLAARGETAALDALLAMTAPESDGGPLLAAALRGSDPASLLADLVDSALYGLAHSRAPAARERLEAIRDGRVRLLAGRSGLADVAGQALGLMDELMAEHACRTAGIGCAAAAADGPFGGNAPAPQRPAESILLDDGAPPGGGVVARTFDTQPRVHDSGLTYANHVDHPDPMTDSRLDLVFENSNLRAGRSDYGGDVACCITVSRAGTGLPFGTPGDGLDVIDNATERDIVLTDPTARVKVVRAINQCSGATPGIIGCAIWGGNGIMLVRMSIPDEGVTWIHEYGHNAGLGHSGDFFGIMFNGLHWANNGLASWECDTFHSPAAGAGMSVVDTGACTDADVDEVQDGIDNCPGAANAGQENGDGDVAGDACDCAPADPALTRVPDPANAVRWQVDSKTALLWDSSVETSVSNVYRGTLDPGFVQDSACLAADVAGTSYEDPATPAPGTGFHYLVTGENACGESNAGQDSGGSDRIFTACP